MWKRLFILTLFVLRNLISSESVQNDKIESVRASRQLNFGECCPCPVQEAIQDMDVENSLKDTASMDDESCPCISASDSEGTSSIFRPVFRAVEPLTRPALNKKIPKPLLNPEVDLASSVLETLHEVTDQEYREALSRDAARSVLNLMDTEPLATESRNVVNIILSPKAENYDDVISEASETQGTNCIPPLGSTYNNFENLRLQPPMRMLKQILSPPIFNSNRLLNRNRHDMDGSASSMQERISQPLKNNILENMKTRLNLLNLKPLSDINLDTRNSPNIFQKDHLLNNIRDRMLLRNKPLLDLQPKTHKESFTRKSSGKMEMESDNVPNLLDPAISLNKNAKLPADNVIKKETNTQTKEPVKEDFGVVPSSSKIIVFKSLSDLYNPNVTVQDQIEANKCSDRILDTDIDNNTFNPNTLQTETENNIIPKRTEEVMGIIDENTNLAEQSRNSETSTEQENVDMESNPSNIKSILTADSEDISSKECSSHTEDVTKLNNINSKDVLNPISAEKEITNTNIDTLPNIKEGIFKTLENFNHANGTIEEKLRTNVQDALQSVNTNELQDSLYDSITESSNKIHAFSVKQIQKKNPTYVTTTGSTQSMSTQDLQKMSDSLLEKSSLKDKPDNSISNYNIDLKEKFEDKYVDVDKVPNSDDMNTLPTSLIENKLQSTIQNVNSDIDIKDRSTNTKPDEIIDNSCSNNIPKDTEYSFKNNEDNEMTAQPSNSIFNGISGPNTKPSFLESLQSENIVQPQDITTPIDVLRSLFNNLRPLNTETISDDFLTNLRLFRLKNDENIDPLKGFAPTFNSQPNLRSYKAKVASPKSLDFNSIRQPYANSDNDEDILGFPSQRMQQTTILKNEFKNNIKNDGIHSLFKTIQTPKMYPDTFGSIAPRLSESFKSHKDNALKTFQESLDGVWREPFSINKNNFLGKPLMHTDDLLGTVLKTHKDFNNKLKDFRYDLNRRLSSISSRTSTPDESRILGSASRLKNTKTKTNLNNTSNKKTTTIPVHAKSPTSKHSVLSKNKPVIDSITKKLTHTNLKSSKADILRPSNKKILEIVPQLADSNSRKGSIKINTYNNYASTNRPANNIKRRPLKENNIKISFATTTTRPDTLKSRSASDSIMLPKLSKSPLDNKPILTSRLKSKEPKQSASEVSIFKALPRSLKKSKKESNVSSPEESEISRDTNQIDSEKSAENISEANKKKAVLLSKIRSAFASRASSSDIKVNSNIKPSKKNENLSDVAQSASTTIDANIPAIGLVGDTYNDNNESFKCKMVCIKDILDSTDTYKT